MSSSPALVLARDPRAAVATFLVLFAVFFCGCRRHHTPPDPLGKTDDAAASSATGAAGVDPTLDEADAVERLEDNFARVHFDFDSARLTAAGEALLDENARILVRHPGLVVEVQGHADPRGTTGYNLALGTLRAQAVRGRLMTRGVASDRLPTVTFGEERPRVRGEDEQANAQNRRVEFRVVRGGSDGVAGSVESPTP